MSRINIVRKIKEIKKEPIKIQDTFESKREKGWDERFIYNKLEDNNQEKRPIPKKAKNDYISNINFLKEQLGGENMKKSNKKRGKSGYKIYHENKMNNNINKNKIIINSNNIFKNDNKINLNNIYNTGEKESDAISLLDNKKLKYTNNNYKIINKNNNSAEYNNKNTNKNSNIDIINKNNNSAMFYSMNLDELEIYLGILWNKLAVKESFQKTFNKLKEDMENEEAKREFTVMEIENLEKLENFLKKLCLEIENRDKAILLLKKLIEVMEKQFIELNLDIRESLLNDFYQTIMGYRINTIKVVESIVTFNQLFSHPINKGKFYEELLIRKYKLFDNENTNSNYLIKIKNDLNFLGNSKINGYGQLNLYFNSNSDPFLLNAVEKVPIDIDYYNRIKQCQYVIMQEVIFDAINPSSELDKINTNDTKEYSNKKKKLEPLNPNNNNSKIINNNNLGNNSYKIIKKEKENISCIDKRDKDKDNAKNYNNEKLSKENFKLKKSEKIEIETQLIDRNNYENFFGTKNLNEDLTEEQTLEELKKEFNIIQNIKDNKKESNKSLIDNKKNNQNIDNIEEIKKEDNKEKNCVQKEKDYNKNKGNDEKKDNKESNKKDIKTNKEEVNYINTNKEEVNDITEEINVHEINKNMLQEKKEEVKKPVNRKIKEIKENSPQEKNNNSNNKEKENITKILKDKDNNEDLLNIEENININEEHNKTSNDYINKDSKENNNINKNKDNNNNKDNNIEENILENSLDVSKKVKKSQERSRSCTPKSQRGLKNVPINEVIQNKDNNISNNKPEIIHPIKDNDYINFYCGKISTFITIYSSYYDTIPEEQKIIFNLKSNLLEYLYNNIYPKIIIYRDKKTKKFKGLCIFSHIFTNEAKNNALYIEHISSYNEEEREKIFENFLNFIKDNSHNIFGFENNKNEKDIYIDLYYKSKDGKFTINTEIRDFFRKHLKFRWVKLENLSKYIRYQKMKHQIMINRDDNNKDYLNNEYDDNILNQSILGRKEFNNDENNNDSDNEEESEDDEINLDISTIFDLDNKNNEINSSNTNEKNDFHPNKKNNLLNNFSIKNKTVLKFNNKIIAKKKKLKTHIKYANPFNLIFLLNKIKKNENFSYDRISPNINSYFNQKDCKIINQILSK